ncbi:MAG: hypothetical protein LBV67_08290 [Streptococcaceae bacterium]|nr:hypothetical protein [Streptococcaceae bacterium]
MFDFDKVANNHNNLSREMANLIRTHQSEEDYQNITTAVQRDNGVISNAISSKIKIVEYLQLKREIVLKCTSSYTKHVSVERQGEYQLHFHNGVNVTLSSSILLNNIAKGLGFREIALKNISSINSLDSSDNNKLQELSQTTLQKEHNHRIYKQNRKNIIELFWKGEKPEFQNEINDINNKIDRHLRQYLLFEYDLSSIIVYKKPDLIHFGKLVTLDAHTNQACENIPREIWKKKEFEQAIAGSIV